MKVESEALRGMLFLTSKLSMVSLVLVTTLLLLNLVLAVTPARQSRTLAQVLTLLLVFIATFMSISAMICAPVNDDVVYYLTNAQEYFAGRIKGELPLRVLMFYLVGYFGKTPGELILATHISTGLILIAAAMLTFLLTLRLGATRMVAAQASAISILYLVNLGELAFLRPDYFSLVFALSGVVCLVYGLRTQHSLHLNFLGSGLLCLAMSMGPRYWLFWGGLIYVVLVHRSVKHFLAVAGGFMLGLTPSVIVFLQHDTLADIVEFTFRKTPVHSAFNLEGLNFPGLIVILVAYRLLCLKESDSSQEVKLCGFFWFLALVNAQLISIWGPHNYILVTWLALSIPLVFSIHREHSIRWLLNVALALAVPMLFFERGIFKLRSIPEKYELRQETIRIADWLYATSRGEGVLCVSPTLPILSPNLWRQFNAWTYCFSPELAFDREQFFDILKKQPAIIQNDPWPEKTDKDFVTYFLQLKLITEVDAASIKAHLQERYVLVKFQPYSPKHVWCGGHFWIRRGLSFQPAVEVPSEHIRQP